ncbi:MAG: ribosome biogenesis GTPase Der, partial [Salibacteraceae bacterium]
AKEGVGQQDLNIFQLIQKNRKGIVVLINKWDLVEKETNTAKDFEADVRERLAPFTDVPILFTSVTEKQRIHKALETALEVYKNRTQRLKTNKLNEVMLPIIEHTPPPATKGKYIKIKYVQQLPTHAPTFAFYCNLPQYINESYRRFIENQMRKHFNLTGVPIQIFFRNK